MRFILTRNRSAMPKTELISLSTKTAASQHLPCATPCLNYSALTGEEGPGSTACLTTGYPAETARLAGSWVSRMGTSPFRHWLMLSEYFLRVGRQVSHGHWSLSHPGFRSLYFFSVRVPLEDQYLPIWCCRGGLVSW